MKKSTNNLVKSIRAFMLIALLFPTSAFAQGLTRSVEQASGPALIPSTYQGYALVGFRLLLGILFLFAGMVGFRAGFNWMYWEGNAKKAKEAKTTLAKSLVFITILFILSALFRWWLGGEYSSLVI